MVIRHGVVTALWNTTCKISSELILLLSKLTRSTPSSFREILLSEAKVSNSVATSVLLAEKELAVFKYYGILAYSRQRISPHFSGWLNKRLSSSRNEHYAMKQLSNGRKVKVAFMITKDQRRALAAELGYTEDKIKKLKPMEALLILEHRIPPLEMKSKVPTLIKDHKQKEVTLEENLKSRCDNVEISPFTVKAKFDESNAIACSEQQDSNQLATGSELTTITRQKWFEVIEVQNNVHITVGLYHDEAEAKFCLETKEKLAAKHRRTENIQFKIKVTFK
mmetsp:Transcript_26237/g.39720  ORF Transcript_26237/g.39720 Transcript_26237/m.39720 type:complete len:279 (+) Transcript_26237:65-901(+)